MKAKGEGPGRPIAQIWLIAPTEQPKNQVQAASMAFIAAVAPLSE